MNSALVYALPSAVSMRLSTSPVAAFGFRAVAKFGSLVTKPIARIRSVTSAASAV